MKLYLPRGIIYNTEFINLSSVIKTSKNEFINFFLFVNINFKFI